MPKAQIPKSATPTTTKAMIIPITIEYSQSMRLQNWSALGAKVCSLLPRRYPGFGGISGLPFS